MLSRKANTDILDVFDSAFFRSLQQLKIQTRRTFLGSRQGAHLSVRRGHGLEFAGFRVYAPGDDFRHIDWGVYGRSDRLYVREFQEEQDLNVMFLIDNSRSMNSPTASTPRKLIFAKQLALAIGYAALTDGDTVSYHLLGSSRVNKYTGPRSLYRAAEALAAEPPIEEFDLQRSVLRAAAELNTPGKCFVLSDFLFDLSPAQKALDVLRARNFDVSLFQVLSPEDISLQGIPDSALLTDSESNEKLDFSKDSSLGRQYASLISEHVKSLEDYCRESAISHTLVSTEEILSEVVLTRLPELGLLR
jgi:uncharacterized protein (DUF58 family)